MPGGGYRRRQILTTVTEATQAPSTAFPAIYRYCLDEVNQRDKDNRLTIIFDSRNWIPLNGETGVWGTSGHRLYRDYFPSAAYGTISHSSALNALLPSISSVALATIARSNPSRPAISIPNFVYELKDLPGMIRDIGRIKLRPRRSRGGGVSPRNAREAANHFLAYQMGWAPLISDLRKLLDFQSKVDKKAEELHNLYANRGLQRRVRSQEWMATNNYTVDSLRAFESSNGAIINGRIEAHETAERWGTVRWSPASLPPFDLGSRDFAKLARDLTFGMKGISPKQVWDAIPWSWLVGWFTNVDDFLQAHHNSIPLVHSKPCVMTKRFTRLDYIRLPGNSWVTGGEGASIRETKERVTNSGSLSASIPFLNGRQFSILTALAIQRYRVR